MNASLNAPTHALGSIKNTDKSMASGKPGANGGEGGGEFASLFGAMMDTGLRQGFAAPASADGKGSPVAGLAAEVLGPTVHIITTAEPVTSDESLLAFARAQGMDEQALALIFSQSHTAAAAAAGTAGTAGGEFAIGSNPPGLNHLAGPEARLTASTAPQPSSGLTDGPPAAARNLLELGPEATLRWSVGDAGSTGEAGGTKTLLTPMFGLNGLRNLMPTASTPTPAAADEPAAHPESANQTLAASLMLGAAEASQAARRTQLKQASQRTERLTELSVPRLPAPVGMPTASGEAEAPIDLLQLDPGLDESELQNLLQLRPADARPTDSGPSNAGNASASGAERTDIALRTEQYEKLSQRLGEALGQRLAAQIARGDWKVEMALRPHDLGNIDIELAMKNGGLEASFSASEARTRDLIADGLPRLKEVLAQLGMDVASVNVNVRQNGQHGGNPTPGKQPGGPEAVSARRAGGSDTDMTDPPPARQGPTPKDGLDLLV